jgi:hypothetical protein
MLQFHEAIFPFLGISAHVLLGGSLTARTNSGTLRGFEAGYLTRPLMDGGLACHG